MPVFMRCSARCANEQGHCPEHARGSSARAKPYNNARWRKARLAFLRQHPLCVTCYAVGIVTAANVVDHVVPHKGNERLMWDRGNWQALCVPHHNAKSLRGE